MFNHLPNSFLQMSMIFLSIVIEHYHLSYWDVLFLVRFMYT